MALLRERASRVAQAFRSASDADLEGQIPSPWEPMAQENAAFPFWNVNHSRT